MADHTVLLAHERLERLDEAEAVLSRLEREMRILHRQRGEQAEKVMELRLRVLFGTAIVLLLAVNASAQQVVNPRSVVFTASPDHAAISHYEIDIRASADNALVQTIQAGKPAPDGANDVTVQIQVQPITFGSYVVRVRAVAGSVSSVDSDASDVWLRAPGAPAKPRVGG